ncbi:MAG TPA: HypC/HybG/HupF family hydrogenase formation chaperone [Thermoplasmata archaeon]|nr:HypC/HybG/HupF family hydrogenase formation chaperone [Thermoplasmata archaeon]
MCLAVPGRIVSIDATEPEFRVARVDFGTEERVVQLLYTPEAAVGSYVIVHAGFATAVIPEDEALAAIATARQLAAVPVA